MAKFNGSNNPMLRKLSSSDAVKGDFSGAMTRGGAIGKTAVLFLILLAGVGIAVFSNFTFFRQPFGWIALIVAGVALSLVTAFVPKASPVTAPLYAVIEGMLLGAISAVYGLAYNGIVFQAILVTVGIFLMTLIFYATRIIRVTSRFRTGIFIATLGVMFVYLADFVLSLVGFPVGYLNDGGIIGIAINVVIVIIAALNFMIDFDYFDRASAAGAPKYMEWYLGYSIMVTFVWLYLEVLRLLSRLSSR
jgi:Predicted membrane protein